MSVTTFAGRSPAQYSRLRSTVQRNSSLSRLSKRPSSSSSNPQKPPASPGSSEKATAPPRTHYSIPGPSWAWIEPLAAPFRAYGRMQKRSPYVTQLSSSLTIYLLGDLSAQYMTSKTSTATVPSHGDETETTTTTVSNFQYEPDRGLRALVIGGISSIPSYNWFLWLGRNFNYPSHALSICVKIVVNQSVFTPIFNSYFFGMQSLLQGNTLQETKRRIVDTVPVSWRNSWKVWPAVTAFSFTFVAPQYRSVFAGVIAIGWQTYLGWLNMKAAAAEEDERGKKGKDVRTEGDGVGKVRKRTQS